MSFKFKKIDTSLKVHEVFGVTNEQRSALKSETLFATTKFFLSKFKQWGKQLDEIAERFESAKNIDPNIDEDKFVRRLIKDKNIDSAISHFELLQVLIDAMPHLPHEYIIFTFSDTENFKFIIEASQQIALVIYKSGMPEEEVFEFVKNKLDSFDTEANSSNVSKDFSMSSEVKDLLKELKIDPSKN